MVARALQRGRHLPHAAIVRHGQVLQHQENLARLLLKRTDSLHLRLFQHTSSCAIGWGVSVSWERSEQVLLTAYDRLFCGLPPNTPCGK